MLLTKSTIPAFTHQPAAPAVVHATTTNPTILRPYQSDFVKRLGLSVQKHKRIIACAPTGSGKTKMFIQIAKNATSKGRAVIIISESTKIFDQIIGEAGGEEIANGKKHVHIQSGHLYIAMAQTLTRRPLILEQFNRIEPPPLIIIDEAHVGTSSNIIRKLNEDNAALLLGFTATPDARVASHLPEIYKDCVVCCQVDDLIQDGYLCSYRHHARTKAGMDLLQIRNGEFTEESQEKAFSKQEVYDGLFDDLHQFTFKKCMVFVSSIKHCEEMYEKLITAGFAAARYHSQLPNGAYELAKFTELNQANICVSVGSLTKGFDYPPIDLVILMRATTSLPLYLQMVGRASRPHKPTGKTFFQVLDYGDNWKRHGLYWDNRDWEKLWKPVKKGRKKGDGVAPVAMCPQCNSIINAGQRICQFCQFEMPLTPEELAQGELIEVTASYNQLIGKYMSELSPAELAIYAKLKSKQRFAARIAKSQEQSHQGFLAEFAYAMGYHTGWVDRQLEQIAATGGVKIEFADIKLR